METIKTKFSMGDEVWFMYKNTATSSKIISITATICFNSLRINYELELTYRKHNDIGAHLAFKDIHVQRLQDKVFKTKQDLLNSL